MVKHSIEIIQLPSTEKKTIMVRQSSHLTEQILISDKEAIIRLGENKFNAQIFDDFNCNNDARIIKESFHIEDIGCKLTSSEHRLVTAIRSELYNKSDRDINSPRYYMGNYFPNGEIITTKFGNQIIGVPHLLISCKDLLKSFLGKERYSGREQKDINRILIEFTKKYFLIIYKQHILINDEKKINRITEYLPLIRLKRIDYGLTEKEDLLLDQHVDFPLGKSQYLLAINPIWTDQIKKKWVELPHDLNSRLRSIVNNLNTITQATMLLVYYLSHQRSNKNFLSEINEDNLFIKLSLDKYLDPKIRKRKIASTRLEEAIVICKKIGLCKKAIRTTGVQGQFKWQFEINDVIYNLE